jgi:Papain family cysteine protease
MTVSPLAGMGRLIQKDHRNLQFPLPKMEVPDDVRRRFWWAGDVYDQGDTPQCVGYAGYGWLTGGPIVNKPNFTQADLYHWAQERDEWPGEGYDGTSTLGLMKALKDKNYIGEYRWATDAETLIAWLLMKGPVLVGTSWFRDMFTPHNKTGFIHPTGADDGGHEWRIIGADRDKIGDDGKKGAVRMVNSWGKKWGLQGRAWIGFDDLDFLIKHDGEAVTVDELKVAEATTFETYIA